MLPDSFQAIRHKGRDTNQYGVRFVAIIKKEIYEMMRKIYDPADPHKCCFRGPKFIEDKHMRESIMQYNLKNPGQHRRNDKEPTPTNNDVPPQRAHLSDPKVNQMMMDQCLPSSEEPQDQSAIDAIIHQIE